MVKSNQNFRTGLMIVFMLAASPLTISQVQAENTDDSGMDSIKEIPKSAIVQKEKVRTILTERVIDGNLQVRYFEVPEDYTDEQIRKALSFEGETLGWAFVNAKAYNAGIVLFNGKAIKVGENAWRMTSQGAVELGGRHLDLELSGKIRGQNVILHGTASNEELTYKVIFSGKVALAGEENTFAIAFVNAGLQDTDSGETIRLFQLGEIQVRSDNQIHLDEFRKSFVVD
ncbi:MAG: hypothetical protein DWQ19_13310 [Crenarchaeota archaeon]|nr:MAG: hypothetical protein DWQ17_05020 [Thermoproteota archaeon]RDJ34748.1 MAG: hypothetical protein DWQ19_13310 [Thermoproteota archaeon]RDJ38651.1 MAG: hypothetical protein DWQ13_04625 [Thermoproteota archaeon]